MLCQHSNGITTGHKMMSMFVCLSLLTMTNPNQMCEVLLFVCSKMADETNLRSKLPVADRIREVWGRKLHWGGGQGGRETGIRGQGMGVKGTGVKGARRSWGRGFIQKMCCILLILLYFYVLQCNSWISEVPNWCIEVNSGIFTMNLALISLHRRGVFHQPWFAFTSYTSDFGNSPFRFISSWLLPFDSESSQNSCCFGGNPQF